VTFLPAAIGLFRPRGERAEVGFGWAAPLDEFVRRRRRPLLIGFGLLGGLGALLLPQLGFDADPLHTKNPHTEAMQTLYDPDASPLTNPFTIDILAPDAQAAAALAKRLRTLPLGSEGVSINSFAPAAQHTKLAQIEDTATMLGPSLAPPLPTG